LAVELLTQWVALTGKSSVYWLPRALKAPFTEILHQNPASSRLEGPQQTQLVNLTVRPLL